MLYPQLNEARALLDLSGVWQFALGNEEFDEEKMLFPLKNPETMAVPASYNDQKAQAKFRDHYGYAYYQTAFQIPKMPKGQRLVLRFRSVAQAAVVYLNGKLLLRHKGGFLPFEAQIGELARSGENLLAVAVDNRIDFSTLPVGNESGCAMFADSLPGGDKDYYNPFVMVTYGMVYAKFMYQEDPHRCRRFTERALAFGRDYIYWFSQDGSSFAYGRSMTYRFAQAAYFAVCALCGVEAFPLPVLKGILARHLVYWLNQPIFDNAGILTIGYAYPNLQMSESYNAPGSPYWALKAFCTNLDETEKKYF